MRKDRDAHAESKSDERQERVPASFRPDRVPAHQETGAEKRRLVDGPGIGCQRQAGATGQRDTESPWTSDLPRQAQQSHRQEQQRGKVAQGMQQVAAPVHEAQQSEPRCREQRRSHAKQSREKRWQDNRERRGTRDGRHTSEERKLVDTQNERSLLHAVQQERHRIAAQMVA